MRRSDADPSWTMHRSICGSRPASGDDAPVDIEFFRVQPERASVCSTLQPKRPQIGYPTCTLLSQMPPPHIRFARRGRERCAATEDDAILDGAQEPLQYQ